VTAGKAEGGEMQYTLGTDAATAPTDGWSTSVPTGTDAGTYYVWYRVKGDGNHHGYTATEPIKTEIAKAANPATITETAVLSIGRKTLDLSNNVRNAAGEVTFAIYGDAKGCTLRKSILTSGNITGECTIKVTVAGNKNYESKTGTITVTLTEKQTQSLSFKTDPVQKVLGDAPFINPLSGAKTSVTYSVTEGTDVASVANDGTVTIKATGMAIITAKAEETANFAGATASYTLNVSKGDQKIIPRRPLRDWFIPARPRSW
jgi:hypothetical protein